MPLISYWYRLDHMRRALAHEYKPPGTESWKSLLKDLKESSDPMLTQLCFNGSWIRFFDPDAKELSVSLKTNFTLTVLIIYHNWLGDEGAKDLSVALEENRTLKLLEIRRNRMGDQGATALSKALKKNRTLRILSIGLNEIKAKGAEELSSAIKENTSLTILHLEDNHIGDQGAEALSQAIQVNKTLTSLNLSSNKIGNEGAKALSQAIQTNNTLIELDLNSNPIEAEGIENLSQALKKNHTLMGLLSKNYANNTIEAEVQIYQILTRNQEQVLQLQDQFIQALIILARDSINPQSQSSWKQLWSRLPDELFLSIIHFIAFQAEQSIGKNTKQIDQCAMFIRNHPAELNASLQEAVKTQQDFKIKESMITGQFSFFPSLATSSKQKETAEQFRPGVDLSRKSGLKGHGRTQKAMPKKCMLM